MEVVLPENRNRRNRKEIISNSILQQTCAYTYHDAKARSNEIIMICIQKMEKAKAALSHGAVVV